MRRFIGVENEVVWDDAEYPEYSAEEAEVVSGEANALAAEINAEADEADRCVDIADSLEDMAVVADSIVEATPAETQLVQIAGDMASAGSDEITAEDVVPATESFVGRRIAAEAFVEKAKQIWANIKAWLKKIWAKIDKFFYKIFGDIPRLRKNIKDMKKRVEEISDAGKTLDSDGKRFELTSGIGGLMIGTKPAKNNAELKTHLDNTHEACKRVYSTDSFASVVEDLTDKINNFDTENKTNAEQSLLNLNNAMGADKQKDSKGYGKLKLAIVGSDSLKPGTDSAFGSEYQYANFGPLLGGKYLVYREKKINDGDSNLGKAEWIRSTRIELTEIAKKSPTVPDEINFETLTTSQVEDLCDVSEKILDELEAWYRGANKKKLMSNRDKLDKACDKLEASSSKLENADERASLPYVRAAFKYNQAVNNTMIKVLTSLYSHSLSNVRTTLMVCGKSLSQYKKK